MTVQRCRPVAPGLAAEGSVAGGDDGLGPLGQPELGEDAVTITCHT
jgi:hypothetical protein